MRILFGPEHDGLHIDPSEPNGYEWWYFDAISDDERYILVVIFFLGTPMSPYYKAVVDGKNPLPKDWCGVFVSLHERTSSGYQECAYAYNLYTENWADIFKTADRSVLNYFKDKPLDIRLGDTTLTGSYTHNGARFAHRWQLGIKERNLWFGTLTADLSFTSPFLLDGQSVLESEDKYHNWVLVAPDCQVGGSITFAGKTISFAGRGYHDHNFGRLPWSDTKSWMWGRTHFEKNTGVLGFVNYSWIGSSGRKAYYIFWRQGGNLQVIDNAVINIDANLNRMRSKRWMLHELITGIEQTGLESVKVSLPIGWSMLQSSPFYRRFPVVTETKSVGSSTLSRIGIGEVFEPAQLCGPIISRMMWTRIRRRS